MRDSVVLLAVLILAVCASPARAEAPDGIDLTVLPGPGASDVTLGWTGTIPTYTVFRSTASATARDVGNDIGDTSANNFVDTPPAGDLFFYSVVGNCPGSEINCGGYCDLDTDADTVCDGTDNCPTAANADQTDQDGDLAGDVCDYCISDPEKVDRGLCGCFMAENTGDSDSDGVINCHDQCPGYDDALDADRGGLPDACDSCPTGLCSITLPDRFYAELPDHQAVKVSRDGRWIAAVEIGTNRGVLIPTEEFLANPDDTSYYEYMGNEEGLNIKGFSDDNNLVLANVRTYVPQSVFMVSAAAIYDRTNGNWTVLGLYDDAVNIDACRFYSNAGDMTSDGKVVYGSTATVENGCDYVGFRYDVEADDWQLFGGLDGAVRINGVSGDGGVIVGADRANPGGETSVRWTFQEPNVFTQEWLDEGGLAYDVTFDGAEVSLSSFTTTGLALEAHRWTEISGLQRLDPGTLDTNWAARAVAISDDGNVIAGYHTYSLSSGLPFIAVDGIGFGNAYDYLVFRGHTELGGFNDSYYPLDLSSDGRIIVGRNGSLSGLPGWVAIMLHE